MPVDFDRAFVFIHIPRTGGTSIERMFNLMSRNKFFGVTPVETFVEKSPQHFTWLELRPHLPSGFVERAYKFSVVRNPWDRFVSEFVSARDSYLVHLKRYGRKFHESNFFDERHLVTLDAFVKTLDLPKERRISINAGFDGHLETQISYITDEAGRVTMDFVGRFESFDQHVLAIASRLGVTVSQVLRQNASPRSADYRSYYSDYSRSAVMSFYRDDIDAFGYRF